MQGKLQHARAWGSTAQFGQPYYGTQRGRLDDPLGIVMTSIGTAWIVEQKYHRLVALR